MLHLTSGTLGLLCLINSTIMITLLGMLIPSSLPPNHDTPRLFISVFSQGEVANFFCGCVSRHRGHSYLQWSSLLNVFGPLYRRFALCSALDRVFTPPPSRPWNSYYGMCKLPYSLIQQLLSLSSIFSRLLGLGPACHVIIAADSNSPGLLIASC